MKTRTPYESLVRVGRYDGPIGDLVRRYKYQSRQRLDRPLGSLLASAIAGQIPVDDLDFIVPIPITRSSLMRYRFAPVKTLAHAVSRELLVPTVDALTVQGKQRRQTELPLSERLKNVRGVFRAQSDFDFKDATICLMDDVSTSGATFREASRLLMNAGARRIYVACLAKAIPPAVGLDMASPMTVDQNPPRRFETELLPS